LKPIGIPPTPRVSTSALIYDEVIYFFGGYDGETWKNDIFVYDIDRNEWDKIKTKNKPPAPKPRCRHSLSLYRNKIVIFGGNDFEESFNDVHILVLSKDCFIKKCL